MRERWTVGRRTGHGERARRPPNRSVAGKGTYICPSAHLNKTRRHGTRPAKSVRSIPDWLFTACLCCRRPLPLRQRGIYTKCSLVRGKENRTARRTERAWPPKHTPTQTWTNMQEHAGNGRDPVPCSHMRRVHKRAGGGCHTRPTYSVSGRTVRCRSRAKSHLAVDTTKVNTKVRHDSFTHVTRSCAATMRQRGFAGSKCISFEIHHDPSSDHSAPK